MAIVISNPIVTARHIKHGKRLPNPAFPHTVEDKFYWRKFLDTDPRFPVIADKLAVRDWLDEHGFDIPKPEILWIGTDARNIPEEFLTRDYVLKANHGSAMNIFFGDEPVDSEAIIASANRFMTFQHGKRWGEKFYYSIERKLFIEEFLHDASMEMKFYTCRDRVTRVYVRYDRLTSERAMADIWLVDDEGKVYLADVKAGKADGRAGRPLPQVAQAAKEIAEQIGAHFDHIRVDILTDGERLWFSELTLTNDGGQRSGMDATGSKLFFDSWDLRDTWFLTTQHTGWRKLYADALKRRLNAQ